MKPRTTAYSNPSIARYLNEIGRYPLLDSKEEIELAHQVQRGVPEAREKLINANLRLVVRIASRYRNCGLPLEDLISEGNIGLTTAVERFDPDFGTRFSTYAPWWIKRSIKMAIGNQKRTIRVPLHVIDQIRKLARTARSLASDLGRPPTTREVSNCVGLTPQQLRHLHQASLTVTSLDSEVGETGDPTPMVTLIPDDSAPLPHETAEIVDLHTNLRHMLAVLNPREQLVITARFGLGEEPPQTLRDVAKTCGISAERIRQIQRVAIHKLRFALSRQEKAHRHRTPGKHGEPASKEPSQETTPQKKSPKKSGMPKKPTLPPYHDPREGLTA